MDALDRGQAQKKWALISPSFPAQRRGLEHGYLVHEQTPPRTLHLPTLLHRQSRLGVGCIDLADLRGGIDALEQALIRERRGGARLVVVDALSDEDLQTIFAAAARLPGVLCCGTDAVCLDGKCCPTGQVCVTPSGGRICCPAGTQCSPNGVCV